MPRLAASETVQKARAANSSDIATFLLLDVSSPQALSRNGIIARTVVDRLRRIEVSIGFPKKIVKVPVPVYGRTEATGPGAYRLPECGACL